MLQQPLCRSPCRIIIQCVLTCDLLALQQLTSLNLVQNNKSHHDSDDNLRGSIDVDIPWQYMQNLQRTPGLLEIPSVCIMGPLRVRKSAAVQLH